MSIKHIWVIGAGLSGATVARGLADAGISSTVCEAEQEVGGLCRETTWQGQLVSEFGPHIFRTSSETVWRFVNRFASWVESRHHVATSINGRVVPFPPLTSSPPVASGFASVGEFLVAAVGKQVFSDYYDSYTWKRWGVSAFDLAPSMIPLIPVQRHAGGFFGEGHVGIPECGYTALIQRMLDHPLIEVHLNRSVSGDELVDAGHVVWTGRLDDVLAKTPSDRVLRFRAVRQEFEHKITSLAGDTAVINFPDLREPQIRRTDYSRLLPWKPQIIGSEFVDDSGPPAYPVLTAATEAMARALLDAIHSERPGVVAHGRLGRYCYISMDRAIESSLSLVSAFLG